MCPFFFFLAMIPLAFASLSPHASAAAVAARNNGSSGATAIQPRVGSYQQQFLQAHNKARAAAGVPPLVWSYTLQLDSRRYVNELRDRCTTTPLYAWGTDGVYGRSLFKGRRKDILRTPIEAVASWVNEKPWYHRRRNTCTAPDGRTCGGYTQVVWGATTQVGCARRHCRGSFDDTVAVCEYYPPGNIEGQRPY